MNIIVNVDRNWAIGNKGSLLFPISEDLKNFKRLTEYHVVIMGRSTLESLPGGKPLKNRMNIVLSTNLEASWESENLYVCRSIENLKQLMHNKPFDSFSDDEFFVIGGQRVYTQLLPLCTTAYVTKIASVATAADAFFPNLDKDGDWHIAEESEEKCQGDVSFTYVRYERNLQ